MLGGIRAHLTYANVLATLAFFMVLGGGTAWAVDEWTGENIQNGTLTTADYKNNDIRTFDVRNDSFPGGGLTGADLASESVGPSEIAEQSVRREDTEIGFVNGFQYTWQNSTLTDATVSKELQVGCDNGGEVSGGGYVISGPAGQNVPSVVVQRSYAVDQSHWLVRAVVQSGTPTWQLTVVANCIGQ
jgi:hypothetical protein